MRRLLLAALAAALLVPCTAARAGEGDIIVKREPGLDRSERRELRQDAGVKLVAELGLERTELVEPKDGDVAEALAELRADDDIVYAEPDQTMRIARVPNDNLWSWLWGLSAPSDADIDAPEAWDSTLGDGVTVAVVDTGITADHEDLAGQIAVNPNEIAANGIDDDDNGYADDVTGWDFADGDGDPDDTHVDEFGWPIGHGTHVSGTIAAIGDNNRGVVGVAPKAKIVPLRALDDDGSGYTVDIAAAFDYAGKLGVPIVNASLGGPKSDHIGDAIAAHPGTLYVVAAGNDGANADTDPDAYPCALKLANILCVGSSTSTDSRSAFSNYGLTSVDLFAPGSGILSTVNDAPTAYAMLSGTSMASPHVAGTAALALAANPGATAAQLKAALMVSVDPKPAFAGLSVTGGRLNAATAATAINGPLATPTPEPTPEPTPQAPVVTPPPVAVTPPVATPVPTPVPGPALSNVTVRGSLVKRNGRLLVRFSLSQPATIRFSIARRGTTRRLSAWTVNARAGVNRFTIRRRLPTGKTLKPGAYKVSVRVGGQRAL
jgi:subtilisin family serine protease